MRLKSGYDLHVLCHFGRNVRFGDLTEKELEDSLSTDVRDSDYVCFIFFFFFCS